MVTPPPTGDLCGAIVGARAAFNAQLDRFRDSLQSAFGSAVAQAFLPQLAQVRAQGNDWFDHALAACRGTGPMTGGSAATEREATAALGS